MLLPLVNMQQQQQQQLTMTKVSISILVMALPVLYVSVLSVPPATLFRDTTFWFLMSNSIIVVIAADSGMLFFGSSCATYVDDRPFLASGGDASGTVVPVEELLPVVIMNDQELLVTKDIVHGDTVVSMDSHAHALVVRGDHGGDVKPKRREMAPEADGATVKARLTASRSLAREERAARRRRSRSHSHALVAAVPDDQVQDKSMVVREEKLRRTVTERRPRSTATAEEEEESEFYARLSDEELNRRVEDFITRFNREIRLQVEKELQV
ncbi:unnamed protein product [Alopecurus aequalis]